MSSITGYLIITSFFATTAMQTSVLDKDREATEKTLEKEQPKVPAPITLERRTGQSPLHHAAIDGDLEQVKKLFTTGTACTPDVYGITPLHDAVYRGHQKIVLLLVNRAAALDVQDIWG